MMKRVVTCALALALCAGGSTMAYATGSVEEDTQTDVIEVATQESSSSSSSGTSTTTSNRPLAQTGDETSMVVPACLAGAASALILAGVATRRAGDSKEE